MSGFEAAATIGGLYDSQTIDVLFVCVVTMLGLREMRSVRSREKCGCGRAAECRHFEEVRGVLERIVPKAKDPGRREARWRRLLAVSYVALAVHAVWPSVAIVRTGAELEGVLVAITSTVICGLLVPLLALCRPESGDRGRECGKEPRRGGAEGGGDGAMAAARIVLVVSLFVGVGGVGAKLEGQTAGDGASELAETTEGLQRWYTVWVENGEALVLLPGSDHWGFVVGRFGTGDVKEIEFTATSGVRYKVGGAGAAAARDLDICVYDAGGGQIRCDDAADTIPLVSFVAESTGTYKAQLIATDVERPTTAGMILVRVGVP
ncbi:hypothetical protein [Candidatus Palauibacter sp.]|uniref:hypothetical protein n=1 Tax=Candidatus Palauibacter sp. TaxID=3101350 RepID=UPI003B52EC99